MEDPRKHVNNKRKNSKITPAAINIGAGAASFGMRSIVLLGAGLVTATLVSALAFKTRRRRRSSSENSNNRSPSPETPSVHAPNQLESMIKTSKDFSADSLPLNIPKSSSDEVIGMKEMQTKNIQNLTQDRKHNSGIDADEQVGSVDSNEDVTSSVAGGDQKNTLICVDFVSHELDNANEVVVLEYEEAVMAANNESGPPTSEEDSSSETIERDDGDEEHVYSTLTDNENKEQDDQNLLISIEVVASIEEHEAHEVGIQVEESMPLGDDIAVENNDEEIPNGHVGEGQEKVFMNEEAACVNKIKEAEDNPQVQFLEEKQEDVHDEIVRENSEVELIEEVGYGDQIVDELVIQEVIDAACVHQAKVENESQAQFVQEEKENDQRMPYDSEQVTREEGTKAALEDILEINNHEVASHTHGMHLNGSLKVSVDDQTAVKEDDPPTKLVNEEERCKETEEMITENELVKKDEIPNVLENNGDLIDETGYADQVVGELVVEKEAIDTACVDQIEEQDGPQLQFVEDEKENDQEIQHDSEQIMVEEEIKAACVDSLTVEDIMETTDHEVALDAQKMDLNVFFAVKEDNPPTQLMTKEEHKKTEDELVVKDEASHVQSIEEDDESEITKASSDESEDSSEKAKISDHEIQEKEEEKQTILSKKLNDSEHNGIIKEDKVSESASRGLELEFSKGRKQALASEPWNLKLLTWSMVISIWCLCHWYFELAFPEVSVAGGILFILIFLCYQNRSTYKYA